MIAEVQLQMEMSSQNRRSLNGAIGKSEITQTKVAQHLKRIDSSGQVDPPGTGQTALPGWLAAGRGAFAGNTPNCAMTAKWDLTFLPP